jgi:hypothetical protein
MLLGRRCWWVDVVASFVEEPAMGITATTVSIAPHGAWSVGWAGFGRP